MSLLSSAARLSRRAAATGAGLLTQLRLHLPEGLGGRGPFIGRYASFAEVPTRGDAHNEEAWVAACLAEATRLRDSDGLQAWQKKSRELEPLLVAVLGLREPLTIVDFGGAIGFSYLLLKRRLAPRVRLDYHVIDQPAVCDAGREFFAESHDLLFHESTAFLERLPPGGLLNIASALQYIEDWRGTLTELVAWRPRFCLFTQLTAGEQPTFAAAQQNLPGAVVAHWFFNEDEVVSHMATLGYDCRYRSRCESPLNQLHHSPELRIGHYRNLLFARVDEST